MPKEKKRKEKEGEENWWETEWILEKKKEREKKKSVDIFYIFYFRICTISKNKTPIMYVFPTSVGSSMLNGVVEFLKFSAVFWLLFC